MFPPVTFAPNSDEHDAATGVQRGVGPHDRVAAVPVDRDRTGAPAAGGAIPATWWISRPDSRSMNVSVIVELPPAPTSRMPVSPG